jgi:hypothetical protein
MCFDFGLDPFVGLLRENQKLKTDAIAAPFSKKWQKTAPIEIQQQMQITSMDQGLENKLVLAHKPEFYMQMLKAR